MSAVSADTDGVLLLPWTPQAINGQMDCSAEVPINSGPMAIDSPMFEGLMEVHLKGLPSSQSRIFDGKKRFFQIMVQVGNRSDRPRVLALLNLHCPVPGAQGTVLLSKHSMCSSSSHCCSFTSLHWGSNLRHSWCDALISVHKKAA